jgi:P-type E1-E2 ATPase
VVAEIDVSDPIRTSIRTLLDDLRRRGVAVHVASGDAPEVVAAVGAELGFTPDQLHGGCSPEAKAALVQRLAIDGPVTGGLVAGGLVAMVGDGLNDAPAMAKADAAIGLTGGLESALSSCHVFVARADAEVALADLLAMARGAQLRIRLILGVSLVYNAIGVVLAAVGVWGPYLCAVAMPASSLTAVFLATWRKPGRTSVLPRLGN